MARAEPVSCAVGHLPAAITGEVPCGMTGAWRRLLAASGLTAVALLAVACTDASSQDRQALTAKQQAYLDDLENRNVDLDQGKALTFLDWYCDNLTADIADIYKRTMAAGVEGESPTNEMLNAANTACVSRPGG